MMKSFWTALIALLFAACAESTPTSDQLDEGIEQAITEETEKTSQLKRDARLIGGETSAEQLEIESMQNKINAGDGDPLIGYWVGAFGKNKINIALAEIVDGQVSGHSICAGNYRPLKGTATDLGKGVYEFLLDEPGDDKYDGRFEFKIDTDKGLLTGNWTPFKAEGNALRTYELKRRKYAYDSAVGTYPQASVRRLQEEDVENLSKEELGMMRNEIYARHGYCFKNKEYRYHFENEDWYLPMGVDIRQKLTDVEVDNIDLIYLYEEYLEEYYDDYGR